MADKPTKEGHGQSPALAASGQTLVARIDALEEQLSRLAQIAKTLAACEARSSTREVARAAQATLLDFKSCQADDATGKLKERLEQATLQAGKLHSAALERFAREMEPLRVEVGQAVLSHFARKGKEGANLFALADAEEKGVVECRGFLEFVEANSQERFPQERLKELFDYLDEDGRGVLQPEEFERCFLVLYKVSRPNVDLCHTMGLTQGKLVRRLQLNETLELVEGPVRESNKVVRVRCRSLQDGAVGWAKATGSNGVVFVQQTRVHYQVKSETVLTSAFIVDDSATTIRQLKEGELLEVLVWERLDKQSGLKRLKGRALKDGAVGWATTVGNGGTQHLQVV